MATCTCTELGIDTDDSHVYNYHGAVSMGAHFNTMAFCNLWSCALTLHIATRYCCTLIEMSLVHSVKYYRLSLYLNE